MRVCNIEGCERKHLANGLCDTHNKRRIRGTNMNDPVRQYGDYTETAEGYLALYGIDHPLSRKRGYIKVHRMVLYDSIGDGPHPCHWCGTMLKWTTEKHDQTRLCVDHIDGDRKNNTLSNLVPSCLNCNIRR